MRDSRDSLYHQTITAPGVSIAAARVTTGIFINTFLAVDFLQLGTDAISYAVASGTSMTTPHVSGTEALMLDANPTLTPDQAKTILQASATPIPDYALYKVAAGYLNAYNAVTQALALRVTRFEESAATLAPAGGWVAFTDSSTDVKSSDGTVVAAPTAGATATFTFTGTGVSWIGFPSEFCGIVRVWLDGILVGTVDTYAATRPTATVAMFTSSGLIPTSHTLVIIEVTGTTSAPSEETWIVVDAFDVTR